MSLMIPEVVLRGIIDHQPLSRVATSMSASTLRCLLTMFLFWYGYKFSLNCSAVLLHLV
jgi:hypothetical protein